MRFELSFKLSFDARRMDCFSFRLHFSERLQSIQNLLPVYRFSNPIYILLMMQTLTEEINPLATSPTDVASSKLGSLGDRNMGLSLQQLNYINIFAFVITVAVNGLASTGAFSEYSVGDVSSMNPTLITPAGSAFSIWGIIYSLEAFFVLYAWLGWTPSSKEEDAILLHGVGLWFPATCLFNVLWIVTFVQGSDLANWFSTLFICGILFSLCKMYTGAYCWQRKHPGGLIQTVALDIHISMYAGWVTVATIVNFAVAFKSTGWRGGAFSESTWSVIMQCVALLLDSYIVISRRDCVWGFVLTWASYWISDANPGNDVVKNGSLVVCGLSAAVSAAVTVKVLRDVIKAREVLVLDTDQGV